MIHIVNPQTSEILDYITLDNIIDDTHKKSLESYLETYDAIVLGGNDFSYDKHLEKRNHIIIPDEDGTYQEFILFEVDKYRDTEGRKTHFYAHATYLELKKAKVIYPTRREGFTLSQHAGWALNNTGWRVGIVESEGVRTFNIENHTNPYEFIKRLANEFEVEIRFRVEHDGRRITARYIDFLERIGDWKGREVEFGRDLDSIRRVEKQDIVTALLGLGPERDDGTRIEVLVEDEEALQRWGRVDEQGNLHHLIEPYEIQSDRQEMTEEEARQYTRTALDKRISTQVTYETTILDLEEVPGLEHEKIRFGDTIRIKDTYFNPPLYLEARVFEIERSIKNKAKKDIKLGDYVEYTEEEVNAIWNQLRNEIRRRLDRLAIVTINSTAGNVFKNAQGETELTARTFVNGAERDEDGTLYDYQWMRFDKDGNHDTNFYAEGKTITVKASDIDEKATYRVLVAYELEVINTAEITISNVFDGEDGEPGPPGPKGDKGDKGDPGPQGPPGTSVESIVEYYLATDQNSGVTTDTPGWTTTMQQMTPQERYLWNYERINFSDGTHQNTNPVIIGVYGDEGEEGRSVVDITEYYLATSESSGVTRDTSGWTTTMQVTTPEEKYLWNYEKITWNKVPLETYTEPVIIGIHGEQGPKGEDGKTFYTWIKYADTPTSGMSDNPEGKEYIGIAYNKETPTPSTNYADYTWSKFKGEQGIPGPPGEDGQPTYTWVKYADDENGNGMSDSPDGKLYIGLAFNKTTPQESNNPADYTWSLMPQNIEIGGRNLASLDKIRPSGISYTRDGHTFILSTTGSATGIRIDEEVFTPYKEYVLSFKIKKISGDIVRIAGHAFAFSVTKGVFIDGEKVGDVWGNNPSNPYPNDNEEHEVTVYFKYDNPDYTGGRYFVIQPNRPGYGLAYTAEVWDLMVVEGNETVKGWQPAPEDVQEQIDEAKQEAQQAKTTADGKNSVFRQSSQPSTTGRKIGDVWFDTSRDNLMHVFNGTSWAQAKWGEQSIVANSITANHIKSLVGLNVNDQFVVDSQGNVEFAGHLQGASGTFSGDIEVQKTKDNQVFSNVFNGDEFRFVKFKKGITNPDTKNIDLSQVESLARIFHDGVGIASSSGMMALGLDGIAHSGILNVYADWIIMSAVSSVDITSPVTILEDLDVWESLTVGGQLSTQGRGVSYGLALEGVSGDHYIVGHNTTGVLHIYPHRESGEHIFRIRSHVNKSSYRNDFWIDSNGDTYTGGDLRVETGSIRGKGLWDITTSNSANARIGTAASDGYSRILRSTSARKYKVFIEEADVDPYKILKLKPKSWIDKGEYIKNGYSTEGLKRYYGIIADEMEEIGLPEYVDYANGEVENIVERAWTLLIPIVKDLNDEVKNLKERLERLENERNSV